MIGIIAAMDVEVNALRELMQDTEIKNVRNVEVTTGLLSGKEVVLCQSGVGKVFAAISTTVILDEFDIEYIINIGSAGSLDSNVRVGSVVIPEMIAHHDIDVPGWDKGFVETNKRLYHADEKLINRAKTLADDKTYFGPMVSGESFIYLPSQTTKIIADYPGVVCCEMEGAAIAQTCDFMHVPFIIIRSISDVTIEEGNEVSYDEFVVVAAKNSAKYCEKFVKGN